MKEENPDLVIMYYGLSPLLLEHYDLHSPDDLVYCSGDYDLETNRRIFFSSLCGELGMPTYGSSGYDWESALDIWFDSAPSGSILEMAYYPGLVTLDNDAECFHRHILVSSQLSKPA